LVIDRFAFGLRNGSYNDSGTSGSTAPAGTSYLNDVIAAIAGMFESLRLRRQREAEEQQRRWKSKKSAASPTWSASGDDPLRPSNQPLRTLA
jgi:hypothetical protein